MTFHGVSIPIVNLLNGNISLVPNLIFVTARGDDLTTFFSAVFMQIMKPTMLGLLESSVNNAFPVFNWMINSLWNTLGLLLL